MQSKPQASLALQARRSRRAAIEEFFRAHLGQRFGSPELHARFGPAFRSRVSEINRDTTCSIRIVNATTAARDERGEACERSAYCAELRTPSEKLSADFFDGRRLSGLPLFDADARVRR